MPILCQIFPIWIALFNQFILPNPAPSFQAFLPINRGQYIIHGFIIYQHKNLAFIDVFGTYLVFMLPNPTFNIICYAHIKRPTFAAGHHIDKIFFRWHLMNTANHEVPGQARDDRFVLFPAKPITHSPPVSHMHPGGGRGKTARDFGLLLPWTCPCRG